MTTVPSHVTGLGARLGGPDPGRIFPTYIPDPEVLIYNFLREASGPIVKDDDQRDDVGQNERRLIFPEDQGTPVTLPASFGEPADLAFFTVEGPGRAPMAIPLVRGWPAYPGQVPGIGVALGNETEDEQSRQMSGGFAGDVYAIDNPVDRNIIATASYYSEPQYTTVVVELIHENRDERDRLHLQLRRLLYPLERKLPLMDRQIWRAKVDAEKQEVAGGPPDVDQPFVVYISLFTVHCWYEMLQPENVTGADGVVEGVDLAEVQVFDAASLPAQGVPPDAIDLR